MNSEEDNQDIQFQVDSKENITQHSNLNETEVDLDTAKIGEILYPSNAKRRHIKLHSKILISFIFYLISFNITFKKHTWMND